MQKAKRHETFVSRQRLFSQSKNVSKEDINKVKERLSKLRYNVREEDGHVLAERGRFSRWGPYVNHIGLIIILIGAIRSEERRVGKEWIFTCSSQVTSKD